MQRAHATLPQRRKAIVAYAVKFNYLEIISEAAPLMLHKPLSEIISEMPAYLHIPWIRYHEHWSQVLPLAIRYPDEAIPKIGPRKLAACQTSVTQMLCKLVSADVASLQDLDALFHVDWTYWDGSSSIISKWREDVEAAIKEIPKFSTFLKL